MVIDRRGLLFHRNIKNHPFIKHHWHLNTRAVGENNGTWSAGERERETGIKGQGLTCSGEILTPDRPSVTFGMCIKKWLAVVTGENFKLCCWWLSKSYNWQLNLGRTLLCTVPVSRVLVNKDLFLARLVSVLNYRGYIFCCQCHRLRESWTEELRFNGSSFVISQTSSD